MNNTWGLRVRARGGGGGGGDVLRLCLHVARCCKHEPQCWLYPHYKQMEQVSRRQKAKGSWGASCMINLLHDSGWLFNSEPPEQGRQQKDCWLLHVQAAHTWHAQASKLNTNYRFHSSRAPSIFNHISLVLGASALRQKAYARYQVQHTSEAMQGWRAITASENRPRGGGGGGGGC